jgi:uncharacterized protein (DUF1810 family)
MLFYPWHSKNIKHFMHSNLNRFIEAQENIYNLALSEMKAGEKKSHWMWFVFPQIACLGTSNNAKYYGIKNSIEAEEYLQNEILGRRLIEVSTIVFKIEGKSAFQIFDHPDYLKFKSCMTLFASLQNTNPIFQQNLDKYFKGMKCEMTIYFLQTE